MYIVSKYKVKSWTTMYIEKIKSPADLKGLDMEALRAVAEETRAAVINRVSRKGGHVVP